MDFNLLFPQWPAAFPQAPGSYAPDPPRAAFANLKEGFAWSDAERGFAITVRKVAECDSQVRSSTLGPMTDTGILKNAGGWLRCNSPLGQPSCS